MLPDPTERNVNPLLFQTRIRTMKKLVLTLTIHDKDVTIAKAAQVCFIVRTGVALPFEECRSAKAHRHNKFCLSTLPKQRLTIAVPPDPRLPSPVKVQVRGSWDLLLCTPLSQQGFDSPPQSSKQWPAPPASSWPDSCALPTRVRARTRRKQGDRPRCVVRSFLHPVPLPEREEKHSLLSRNPGTTAPRCNERRCSVGHCDCTHRNDSWEIFRLRLPLQPALASSCNLPDACCKGETPSQQGAKPGTEYSTASFPHGRHDHVPHVNSRTCPYHLNQHVLHYMHCHAQQQTNSHAHPRMNKCPQVQETCNNREQLRTPNDDMSERKMKTHPRQHLPVYQGLTP